MYFRSKYDWWLTVMIVAGIVAIALEAVENFPSAIAFILVGIALLMCWVFFGTGYHVLEDRIIIRSGPFTWTVILTEIISVRPTRNPLSAPASSVDRLELRHKKGAVLISPKNKEAFIHLLKERCPKAQINIKG